MGRAMLGKSLIQFSVDGQRLCCPNYSGDNEDNAISFKRSHACTAALSAPNPAPGHGQPTPPPETLRHSWASLGQSLVGSLLLSPGSLCTQVLFVPPKCLFFHSCVSSGSSMVGLMATSSKRAYSLPRSAAPRLLLLGQATADPYLHRRQSNTQRQVWLSLYGVS